MRFKTTFWLLAMAALLAGAVQLSRRVDNLRLREHPAAERFLDVQAESVDRLTVLTPDYRVVCVRHKGGWRIAEPLDTWADKAAVDRMLSALESLSGKEIITHEQRRARALSLADYGLMAPRIRIGVTDRLKTRVLFVGDEAPLGDLRYVRVVGAPDVIGVPREFADVLPPRLDGFRDRALLHGNVGEAVRLDVQAPDSGFVQMSAVSGEWRIQQPLATRADRAIVERMLDRLFALRIENFVWDTPAGGPVVDVTLDGGAGAQDTRFAPYGLAQDEALRVSMGLGGGETRQELWFGKEHGESNRWVYVKTRDGNSVYSVEAGTVRSLPHTLDALRARDVFLTPPANVTYLAIYEGDEQVILSRPRDEVWSISDPARAPADQPVVLDLVEQLCRWRIASFVPQPPGDAASYGLAPPRRRILLAEAVPSLPAAGPDAAPPPADLSGGLLLGRRTEEGLVYGAFDPRREVFLLPAEVVDDPRLSPRNALLLRDRTMLAVARERIVGIRMEQPGMERTLALDETGTWKVESAEGNAPRRVLAGAIEDLLLAAANLRALRVEALAPADVSAYGLSAPRASVTLALRGDNGIRKALLIGGSAATGGVYAMVKGQDVVFVLDSGDVAMLLRDLTTAEARP